MARRWSDDEDRVVIWAHRRLVPRKVIGREIGRSAQAILEREERLGLSNKADRRPSFSWNYGMIQLPERRAA
jgi:hypothetical protein